MLFIFSSGTLLSFASGPLSSMNSNMESTPAAILCCCVTGLSLLFFPRDEGKIITNRFPGLWRRYFAANIDMMVAMFLAFSILFPLLLLVENSAREEWVWSWDVAISPFYGAVQVAAVFVGFSGIYLYFRIHLERDRATPGQYIFGYRIIPNGQPDYNRRIWDSALVSGLWPFVFLLGWKNRGIFPWDKNSNSQAVRVN